MALPLYCNIQTYNTQKNVTVLPTHIVFDNRLRYDSAVGGKCRHGSLKI